ncbi:MAG: acetolactate synthase large subunit [Rhizomicrobium sp.]
MNGAESLVRTLVAGGVDTCFMNPGTSEIHVVSALDRIPEMRGVPCLFEGVASGAADGYARMAGKPASTLLHLGPGLSNALANLHNACRAHVPLINIVGDHASFHRQYETPLTSDVEALARPLSAWLRRSASAAEVGPDCAEAIKTARRAPGRIATLILPADTAWGEGGVAATPLEVPAVLLPAMEKIAHAAQLLQNGRRTALILGAGMAAGAPLTIAAQIAHATGAKLFVPFAFTRLERGAGRPRVERIAYVTEQAIAQLAQFAQIVLVGAPSPVSFFGHPEKPSILTTNETEVFTLARPEENCTAALRLVAEEIWGSESHQLQRYQDVMVPSGDITLSRIAACVGALLPDNAIVVDESITSGRGMMAATAGAPPHDWLVNTGGSIGIGLPLAVGAAIASPERPVLCLEADGSAMYTLQALWTAAREGLKITTVIFANHAYAILKGELANHGINAGRKALELLDLNKPEIDWVALAKGLGVPATRVATTDEFASALQRGFECGEPNLIEVPL